MHLSVVIPAYNEEGRIQRTLDAVFSYLTKQSHDFEIIVVSDGSTDKTVDVVKVKMAAMPNLRVIANPENHGKGYVVRQAMLAANGDFRVFMDADNATTIDHVEKLWPEFNKGYSLVIGSRDVKGADIAVAQPYWRRRLGDIFNLIVQVVSGLWGIWDTQCGFKGFEAKAAKEIFAAATINRWAFDVELLVIARKRGYRIKEVPVRWINDPNSKVKFSGMVHMLLEVLNIRKNLMARKYDKKD